MSAQTAFITGTTHGIGTVTARELARAGLRVVMGCRDTKRGEVVRDHVVRTTANTDVHLLPVDLADLDAVRACAHAFLDRFDALHVLVNNAGMMTAKRELAATGVELMLATNHLGPYLLTRLLLERVCASAPARIVVVASRAHFRATLDLDDLDCRRGFGGLAAYARSKLANVLFTRALARRLEGSGVTVNCLHPGVVATNIIPRNSRLLTWGAPLAKRFMLTPERGARTTLELALGPLGGKESGGYFDEHGVRREPSLVARDDALAERLWLRSAELVGLPA